MTHPRMRWVYASGGAAIVLLTYGTIFGLEALSDARRYDEHPSVARRDLGKRNALVADVFIGLGIGLAATSAALFFMGRGDTASAHAPALFIAPVVSPGIVGAGLSLRF